MSFPQLKSLIESPQTVKQPDSSLYVNNYTCITDAWWFCQNTKGHTFWKCVKGKYDIPKDLTKGLLVENDVTVCKFIPDRWQRSILASRSHNSYMVNDDKNVT
jgi:hypothetical protein